MKKLLIQEKLFRFMILALIIICIVTLHSKEKYVCLIENLQFIGPVTGILVIAIWHTLLLKETDLFLFIAKPKTK